MKKIIFIIVLILNFGPWVFAQEQTIAEAEKAYKANEFSQALTLYTEIEKQGFTSPELLYNIANCYYKLNKIAPAILYYERAKLLAPSDADIETNLALANSKVTQKVDKLPQIMISTWIDSIAVLFSSNVWSVFSLLAFASFVFMAGVFVFSTGVNIRKAMLVLGLLAFVFTLGTYFFASKQYAVNAEHRFAVVFEPSIEARSAPEGGGTALFTIHEGIKIEVVKQDGDWAEIKLPDGKIGWLPVSSFQRI